MTWRRRRPHAAAAPAFPPVQRSRDHESFVASWVVTLAMAGKLIMLPFRVWLGSARLLTPAAGGAARCAVALAEQAIGFASPAEQSIEEPVHVSEEPELVREEAEPGAEDGAGAQLRVIEPWNGYARMNARDVITRARQASPAELATVRLYEARNRSRQTVLAAVDRQLKLAGGPHRA